MKKLARVLSVLTAVAVLSATRLLGAAANENGDNPSVTLDGGFGFMSGDLTYRVGDLKRIEDGPLNWTRTESSWSSELEFPKDVPLLEAGATARWALAPQWVWVARLNAWTIVSDPSAKVKDTDWHEANVSEGLYQLDKWRYVTAQNVGRVYSESSAELGAYGFDVKLQLLWETVGDPIGWIVGYRYDQFSYDCFGLEGYAEGTDWVGIPGGTLPGVPDSRKVVTYDFRRRIPYVGLGYDFPPLGRFQASIEGDYSPWVSVKDRDRHVLQGTQYESRTDGWAWMVNVVARYDITERLFARVKADYLRLKTDGDTTKTVYVPTEASPEGITFRGPIDIKDTETRCSLGVGYAF